MKPARLRVGTVELVWDHTPRILLREPGFTRPSRLLVRATCASRLCPCKQRRWQIGRKEVDPALLHMMPNSLEVVRCRRLVPPHCDLLVTRMKPIHELGCDHSRIGIQVDSVDS